MTTNRQDKPIKPTSLWFAHVMLQQTFTNHELIRFNKFVLPFNLYMCN
jgi:adenine-specific DNA glycosylase